MKSWEALAAQIKDALEREVKDPVARENLRQLVIDFSRTVIQQHAIDVLEVIRDTMADWPGSKR